MNGYSGMCPPGSGCDNTYGKDCSVVSQRILSYLFFINKSDDVDLYQSLLSRIVPIGFNSCDPSLLSLPPSITRSEKEYSADDFSKLIFTKGDIRLIDNQPFIDLVIKNTSDINFSAISNIGKPIRLSWRFLDQSGQPLSGWDNRKDLPFDILAKGNLTVLIPLGMVMPSNVSSVQVSLVQEMVFWGHDIGVEPLTIKLIK
jgi:hypothetical protein